MITFQFKVKVKVDKFVIMGVLKNWQQKSLLKAHLLKRLKCESMAMQGPHLDKKPDKHKIDQNCPIIVCVQDF